MLCPGHGVRDGRGRCQREDSGRRDFRPAVGWSDTGLLKHGPEPGEPLTPRSVMTVTRTDDARRNVLSAADTACARARTPRGGRGAEVGTMGDDAGQRKVHLTGPTLGRSGAGPMTRVGSPQSE